MPDPIVTSGDLDGLLIVEPTPILDERGFFVRTMAADILLARGVDPGRVVQENQSRSRFRTLRGMHFRTDLLEQKIVRCARGDVSMVVVDLRPWSSSFLRHVVVQVDDRSHRQLIVPPGCALGFQVLSEWADVCYKHDAYYAPQLDGSLAWDDPDLGIAWPLPDPILSDRDRQAPRLEVLLASLDSWFDRGRH